VSLLRSDLPVARDRQERHMNSLIASACIAAFAAQAIAPSGALAQPLAGNEQVASSTVDLRGVDLHTQAGAREAARRIHAAANFVCVSDAALSFSACRDDAIDRALSSLQSPQVSAALGRQTPAPLAVR
jgi:UrcA family protein